jgi:DNA mismatch endonuclease (patch repair protein)
MRNRSQLENHCGIRHWIHWVHSTDTTSERKVHTLLHNIGFRFRLHRPDLPGKPDIVLPKHHTVVFVHGCFWHRHQDCPHATTPASRQDYWLPKFKRTVARDQKNQNELNRRGWNVIVVWECELRDLDQLAQRLKNEIAASRSSYPQVSPNLRMAAEKQETYRDGGIQDRNENEHSV